MKDDRMETTTLLSEQHIVETVKSAVAEVLGCAGAVVTLESTFVEDLGADSLDKVSLVMALEDKFNRRLPEEAAQGLRTVNDAVQFIINELKTAA